jgi:hypothetical protein
MRLPTQHHVNKTGGAIFDVVFALSQASPTWLKSGNLHKSDWLGLGSAQVCLVLRFLAADLSQHPERSENGRGTEQEHQRVI